MPPSATASPNTAGQNARSDRTETATSERRFPWWWLWLLGIPLLGGLLWWLLKDRGAEIPSSVGTIIASAAPAVPAAPSNSSLFLVPYDGKNAYAYWQIAPAQIEALRRQGGEKLMLRLYDVTGFLDPEGHRPYCLHQSSCEAQQQYLLVTLPAENRDYMVELGYLTLAGVWLPLTRSGLVRVTPSVPTANVVIVDSSSSNGGASWLTNGTGTALTVAATPSYAQKYHSLPPSNSLLFLVPYDGKNAYAYWQIAPAQIEALQRQGGEKLVLRLYDVTDIPDSERHKLHSLHQFDCNAQEQYLLLTLPAEDRDYIVALGYLTHIGNWLPLTRSGTVRVAAGVATENVVLSLMLRDSKNIYAYWEIPPVAVAALKHQGDKS
ncbi:DUF4912 domain-containing protein [Argonema galeatum]|uniref:DUF4912 domain-containing protein n=1 Tax=Argonema galeatum TaxID=2942762 RepID=UPI002012C3A9|nr:DUF4912 domain-containing protein [Argonema galeatum]MCL1468164.1 DUF4912 domain-containing protein [Argonema galeatum A003/A1]